MIWRFWILLAAFSMLTACAAPARLDVQRVEVPVPVKCAAAKPAKPDLVDSGSALKAAPNLFEKSKLLLAGRAQRDGYIAELEASRAGCD